MNKLLLTRAEAAELLGISRASIEALNKSRQLPIVKVGRNVRIHADALADFARKGTNAKTVDGRPLDALWHGTQA